MASDSPLAPAEPFVPYATILKMALPGELARSTVACLNCNKEFPLKDILDDELNDDQCPACKMWALQYWANKPYRAVRS